MESNDKKLAEAGDGAHLALLSVRH
jgi:hypothetical protein